MATSACTSPKLNISSNMIPLMSALKPVERVLAKMDPSFRDEMRDLIARTSLGIRRFVWPCLGHLTPSSMYKLLGLEDPRRVQEDCLLSCRDRRGRRLYPAWRRRSLQQNGPAWRLRRQTRPRHACRGHRPGTAALVERGSLPVPAKISSLAKSSRQPGAAVTAATSRSLTTPDLPILSYLLLLSVAKCPVSSPSTRKARL